MLDPWYVSGLVEGEGCFCITLAKHKTTKTHYDPRLLFEVEMIIDDLPLLEGLREFLGCGKIYILNYERYGWRPHAKFAVKSLKEIQGKVIPFFLKYPLQGKKKKDFDYFCTASQMFSNKEHLKLQGIKKLKKIQGKMNLRKKLKLVGSSAKVRENRAPGGDWEESLSNRDFYLGTPPIKWEKLELAEAAFCG